MSKHILTGPPDGPNWRLHAEANLDDLRGAISRGMTDGSAVEVGIEMNDDPRTRGTLIINGQSLAQVALFEIPEDG